MEVSFNKLPQSSQEFLIDPVCGDIMNYNKVLRKWEPFLNIGIHNIKLSQDTKNLSKALNLRPKFRVKSIETGYE